MRTALADLVEGLLAHAASVSLARRRPRVLRWVLPPVLITAVLFVAAYVGLSHLLLGHLPALLRDSPWLGGVVRLAVRVVSGALAGMGSVCLYLVVSVPFEESIAEDVSEEVLDRALPTPHRGFLRGMVAAIQQALWLAVAGGTMFFLSFVPIVGPPVAFLGNAMIFGYGFTMVPADLYRLPVGDRVRFAWSHRWRLLGLGLPIAGMALVPLFNLVFFPLYLVAGTLLYHQACGEVVQPEVWD